MRVFYRSAPVFMALSVALAGCGVSDPPSSKPTSGSANTPADSSSTASATASASTEVCLTVDGMT